ncbi:TVP38/TMEM64 family protein [Cerasicoccus maritimus]|uniref:TVP38/TMEM64 family protein n=1 Tax=Cerasicoccus maritimus TaxID=490089 RepID=UPI002852B848|nr:VTT domain-containing protein [Cerasicoccus maritimus]
MSEPETPAKPKRTWLIGTLLLAAVAVGVWAALATGNWRDWLDPSSPWALLIFAVLMTFLPMLGFPISAFYVCAGAVFDPWKGIPVGLACLAVNMSLSYALARTTWREPLRRKFAPRWPAIFALEERDSLRLTILIRAIPGIPYSVQNYLLGVLATPFGPYLALSLLIQGCFLSGVALTSHGAISQNGQVAVWGGLVVLVTILGLRITFKRRHADLTPSDAGTT